MPTLRKIDVDYGPEDIRKCCADMTEAELNFGFLMFFGVPGETKETVEESLALVEETDPLIVSADIGMRIYPNTPLAELALKERMISEGQDLYEPTFYTAREVDGWLHDRLAKVADGRSGFAF